MSCSAIEIPRWRMGSRAARAAWSLPYSSPVSAGSSADTSTWSARGRIRIRRPARRRARPRMGGAPSSRYRICSRVGLRRFFSGFSGFGFFSFFSLGGFPGPASSGFPGYRGISAGPSFSQARRPSPSRRARTRMGVKRTTPSKSSITHKMMIPATAHAPLSFFPAAYSASGGASPPAGGSSAGTSPSSRAPSSPSRSWPSASMPGRSGRSSSVVRWKARRKFLVVR